MSRYCRYYCETHEREVSAVSDAFGRFLDGRVPTVCNMAMPEFQMLVDTFGDPDGTGHLPCSILRIRESRGSDGRLVALLMEEPCGCEPRGWVQVVVATPPFEDSGIYPCEACDGSGWRLRANTYALTLCASPEHPVADRVAVCPLEETP